ncbi:hypothetical protein N7539_001919 [Penicillium diatomitis]|uniref:MOSC domain-containing protein n=1 Tax=Penicillium diatomitis TaxID=2819901 RepID=A0A9W9XHM6_9EURO|nr:uncharacterized protein N7539_001919 [Penicillium diatomitis]KAJ5493173.1 hypothetical protein N7539_001919 [Penicillium diatomitis]
MSTTATVTQTRTGSNSGQAQVLSVSKSTSHGVSKSPVGEITLIAGLGVSGDCHAGKTVQHRAIQQKTPSVTNNRQVHIVSIETLRDVSSRGKITPPLSAGMIGENITTQGLDLVSLPCGTELHFVGPSSKAVVVLTGLRAPGPGIDQVRPNLLPHFTFRDGSQVKKMAGVMGIVKCGGEVKPGMRIEVVRPAAARSLPFV